MSSHRPMMVVCSHYEPGYPPKHVDGGQHRSLCKWAFSNGTETDYIGYTIDWEMHHQEKPENWIICFAITMDNILRGMSEFTPESVAGQFYVSEEEASSLMSTKLVPDRHHKIESLMDIHREQAFLRFENYWVHEPDPPKIKFKQ